MSCSMPGCTNARRLKPEGISFYAFPRNDRAKLWLKACGKSEEGWKWSKNKQICSNHFRPEDMTIKRSRRVLQSEAVPVVEKGPSKNVASDAAVRSRGISPSAENSLETKLTRKRKLSDSSEQLDTPASNTETCELDSDSSESVKRDLEVIQSTHNYNISPQKQNLSEGLYRRRLFEAKTQVSSLKREVVSLKIKLRRKELTSKDVYEQLEKRFASIPRMLRARCLKSIFKLENRA